jgi:hypothetical protein
MNLSSRYSTSFLLISALALFTICSSKAFCKIDKEKATLSSTKINDPTDYDKICQEFPREYEIAPIDATDMPIKGVDAIYKTVTELLGQDTEIKWANFKNSQMQSGYELISRVIYVSLGPLTLCTFGTIADYIVVPLCWPGANLIAFKTSKADELNEDNATLGSRLVSLKLYDLTLLFFKDEQPEAKFLIKFITQKEIVQLVRKFAPDYRPPKDDERADMTEWSLLPLKVLP